MTFTTLYSWIGNGFKVVQKTVIHEQIVQNCEIGIDLIRESTISSLIIREIEIIFYL